MSSNSNQPIKILKRQPNTNTTGDETNRASTSVKPRKTLEEREAAYAEARRRILGSSPPPPSSAEESPEPTPVPLPCTTASAPPVAATTLTMPAIVPQQRLMAPQSISYMSRNLLDFNRAVFVPQGMQRYPTHFINQQQPPQPFYYYYQ